MDKPFLQKPSKLILLSTQVTLGGPLINIQGQVIGITSSKIATNGGIRSWPWFCTILQMMLSHIGTVEKNGKVTRPALGTK